jgi:DNA-binding CsgD family transcriptional regulator
MAISHFARALGAARSGKPEAAKADIQKLAELRDKLREAKDNYWAEIVDIQRQVAAAWVLHAEGKFDEALKAMSSAADAEDKTEKAAITPGPLATPARELYGQMLLERGMAKEAVAAFTGDHGHAAGGGNKGYRNTFGTRGGEPYLAHVLLLTTGARRSAVDSHSAIAVVFARKAELQLPHPVEVLATTYQLTPTEMRVLMMIVDVGGVAEVARALGTAPSTLKTHLLRIFHKTGATRQAD